MINNNKKQIKNYLINSELDNKLLSLIVYKNLKLIVTSKIRMSDIKLIKNLIAIELVSNKRAKISVWTEKKTIKINLKTVLDLEPISYFQKKPVVWRSYLQTMNYLESFSFNLGVKNVKLGFLVTQKMSYIDQWIKSAYLD